MKTVKKYQPGGSANAKKVAANKAKVEANRKKVEANREKVLLGKRSPNSNSYEYDKKSGKYKLSRKALLPRPAKSSSEPEKAKD